MGMALFLFCGKSMRGYQPESAACARSLYGYSCESQVPLPERQGAATHEQCRSCTSSQISHTEPFSWQAWPLIAWLCDRLPQPETFGQAPDGTLARRTGFSVDIA
jgi:hypothetical protein